MPNYEVQDEVFRQVPSRNETRKAVIDCFMREEPGTGTGELATKYRYYVESLSDGRRIFLERPAIKNFGFDFVIHVECEIFLNGKDFPRHDDIRNDLISKVQEDAIKSRRLYEALNRVYNCEDPDDILAEYEDVHFEGGLSTESILKIVKWFFIEQDIRYWNYSGRAKFKTGIIDQVLGQLALGFT